MLNKSSIFLKQMMHGMYTRIDSFLFMERQQIKSLIIHLF